MSKISGCRLDEAYCHRNCCSPCYIDTYIILNHSDKPDVGRAKTLAPKRLDPVLDGAFLALTFYLHHNSFD
jgi:hypothetical protein